MAVTDETGTDIASARGVYETGTDIASARGVYETGGGDGRAAWTDVDTPSPDDVDD